VGKQYRVFEPASGRDRRRDEGDCGVLGESELDGVVKDESTLARDEKKQKGLKCLKCRI